jgi:hypothetical protein
LGLMTEKSLSPRLTFAICPTKAWLKTPAIGERTGTAA